jgi:phosphopantetheinyl transferase
MSHPANPAAIDTGASLRADCLVRVADLEPVEAAALEAGEAWLTNREFARLQTIQAELRRRQYLSGHWLARVLAAQSHGGDPAEWRFETNDDPRPRLVHEDGQSLWASLAHSGETLAVAIARHPVGLDLELPRKPRDFLALAGFLFSPEEAAAVAAEADDAQRSACFHAYWTLKEAQGKRSGEGLQPSRTRNLAARPCPGVHAEAWRWPLAEQGSLALAAWPGARLDVGGWESAEPPSPWAFVELSR